MEGRKGENGEGDRWGVREKRIRERGGGVGWREREGEKQMERRRK